MSIEDGVDPVVAEATPAFSLRTGMGIPKSSVRDKLQKLVSTAYEVGRIFWRPELVAQGNSHFDAIGKFAGFSVVETRDMGTDYSYRCAEYVFISRLRESWSLEDDQKDGREFWLDNHEFLVTHGYELVTTPEVGDVIAYGHWDETNPESKKGYFEHFGIYEGSGQVTSKFDRGHVFRHRWDQVPIRYGKHVAFFRKFPSDG